MPTYTDNVARRHYCYISIYNILSHLKSLWYFTKNWNIILIREFYDFVSLLFIEKMILLFFFWQIILLLKYSFWLINIYLLLFLTKINIFLIKATFLFFWPKWIKSIYFFIYIKSFWVFLLKIKVFFWRNKNSLIEIYLFYIVMEYWPSTYRNLSVTFNKKKIAFSHIFWYLYLHFSNDDKTLSKKKMMT
jgi:hypothetical protein